MEQTKGKMSSQETVGVLRYKFNPKPEFEDRMNSILKASGSDEKDLKAFWEIVHKEPNNSIRCNTLKISPAELKLKLEKRGWTIIQPFKDYPEIMIVQSDLGPGELGRSREHMLGYYYVQEISSMTSILVLQPEEGDSLVDVCASPGSKTTQAAAKMNNTGNIIANDNKMGRMIILASNLEKCGVSNTIVTKRDGVQMSRQLKQANFNVDKILVDAPCSGEGTIRSSPKTFIMWNLKTVENLSRQQKVLAASALELLKEGGDMVYSTCTHSPEENEEVVQFLLDNYDIELEKVILPLKTRKGLTQWQGKKFNETMKNCARIYPQDNDTEGFFVCKIKKISNKKLKGDNHEIIKQFEEENEEDYQEDCE